MPESDNSEPSQGWAGRVAFAGGPEPFAYVPHQVIVAGQRGIEVAQAIYGERVVSSEEVLQRFTRLVLADDVDPLRVIQELRLEGVVAQPNHVLFAHDGCDCCCGPHPAARWQCVSGNPLYGNPLYGNPLYSNPLYGNPLYGNPLYGNPLYGNPLYGNPLYGNPLYGNPVYGNPVYATWLQATGHHHSSAKPAPAPVLPPRQPPPQGFPVRIAILDTGLAADVLRPHSLDGVEHPYPGWEEMPDTDGDGYLDPAVGHGTFISGIIESLAPGCEVLVEKVLDPFGAGDEVAIALAISSLEPVDLLNLSLGGYALQHMDVLAAAIRDFQDGGGVVVSSAGNDGICRPSYPAAFPDVVAVGALGPGGPAAFSNYGPWIRACAPGVDVISTFFTYFQGPEPAPAGNPEPDLFEGWACWSGTSFSAPTVAAALAREMQCYGVTARDAVARVIDAPGLVRIPDFGTVVNLQ